MKITIANKRVVSKPYTPQEKQNYFNGLSFKTGNFSLDSWKKIIENGYTITYNYKDSSFSRADGYMKNNYCSTDFICVDVDSTDIAPSKLVEQIKFKPTLYHTTFSNLTVKKENKYCYHLIYCFTDSIYGEDNFKRAFEVLTADYRELIDEAAKDCHRVMFTSNSTLPNFEASYTDLMYNPSDLLTKEDSEFDSIESFFITPESKEKKERKEIKQTDSFTLDGDFFNDLNSMDRKGFVVKYESIYPYVTNTEIQYNEFGYADLRETEYYEVYNKYVWNPCKGKGEVRKITNGNRTSQLFTDGMTWLKIIPDITKEHLVTLLITDVLRYFDNSDKELTNYKIIEVAKGVWENRDINYVKATEKKFKIDSAYWKAQGVKPIQAVAGIRMYLKDEEIQANLDLDLTIEENLKNFKNNGVKCTKKRLIDYLNYYGLTLKSDKEIRDINVMEIYENNPDKSYRQLVKICKDEGVSITDKTIKEIVKKYTSAEKN